MAKIYGTLFWQKCSFVQVEQVRQLASLVETQLEYHRQSADILETLHTSLQHSIDEINQRPEPVCIVD